MIPITLHLAFLNTSFRVITKPTFTIKIDILVPEVQHLSSWLLLQLGILSLKFSHWRKTIGGMLV